MNLISDNPRLQFMLRWLLANVLGWALGLFLGGVALRVVGSILGVLLGGAVTGVVVGVAQAFVLRADRRWWVVSAVGGGLAALPAYVSGITLIAGPVLGYFVIGAVYGAIFGAAQWVALRHESGGWWVAVNGLAGGLCGCLTLGFNPLGLPLVCSLGPVVFGLLTGVVLLNLWETEEDDGG